MTSLSISPSSPRLWPHVRIEDGPPIAGLAPDDLRRVVEELAATRAATPDEIANVVRGTCAEAYARELALVEECGVFAG